MKILINAYACSPNMGSEPGMAWNWCVHLAEYCELYIITEGEFRDKIEAVTPNIPQGKNMHFYYNPMQEKVRQMCWNQGDWRFYKYYKQWQWKTYKIAKEIIKKEHIDILHQLNMIGFREPGYLWKINELPLIWGPVDAKEKFPIEYLNGANWKTKFFILLKNAITRWQLNNDKRINRMVKRSSAIISASSNSQETFRKFFFIDTPLINETGCYINTNSKIVEQKNKPAFDLLWVGKMDFRKQLILAIRSIAIAYHTDLKLHIVGNGDISPYQKIAKELGITSNCVWHGVIPHEEVQNLMQRSDLFFFTSVAEGTPHVVLEAISNQLPVLCFNTCGHGDSINDETGIKIPLTNPEQSIKDFAEKIEYLYNNRNILKQMSDNCLKRQKELSWENKAKKMVELYQKTINKKPLKSQSFSE